LAALHDSYEVAQALLDSGADPTKTNSYGFLSDSLHHCHSFSSLWRGITDHTCHRHGESVLHYAIMSLKKGIVEKLLEKGIDPRTPPDAKVPSPLQLAASMGPKGKEIFNILRG